MQNKNAPVIFVHYGKSSYLYYTLSAAKKFNIDKKVILIGDKENEKIALKAGLEFHNFNDLNYGNELIKFNEVYKHIAGSLHGREFWTNFVFKRWFYVYNCLKTNNIEKFWHFDSDNLIIDSLSEHENKFIQYDCTEQCNGKCMNGFISNINTLKSYLDTISELFLDEQYINQQKIDFIEHPDFAFTEMRAYLEFKKRKNINSIRLNTIINNQSFDDCICWKNEMETYKERIWGQNPKKIYFSSNGKLYCKHEKSGLYVKMISLNMSWVPTYFIKSIYSITTKKSQNENSELILFNIYKKPFLILIKDKTLKVVTYLGKVYNFISSKLNIAYSNKTR